MAAVDLPRDQDSITLQGHHECADAWQGKPWLGFVVPWLAQNCKRARLVA